MSVSPESLRINGLAKAISERPWLRVTLRVLPWSAPASFGALLSACVALYYHNHPSANTIYDISRCSHLHTCSVLRRATR